MRLQRDFAVTLSLRNHLSSYANSSVAYIKKKVKKSKTYPPYFLYLRLKSMYERDFEFFTMQTRCTFTLKFALLLKDYCKFIVSVCKCLQVCPLYPPYSC